MFRLSCSVLLLTMPGDCSSSSGILESWSPLPKDLLGTALTDCLPASQGVGEETGPCHRLYILLVPPGPSPGRLQWLLLGHFPFDLQVGRNKGLVVSTWWDVGPSGREMGMVFLLPPLGQSVLV